MRGYAEKYGEIIESRLEVGTAWCWACAPLTDTPWELGSAKTEEALRLALDRLGLSIDWNLGLRPAQANANIAAVRAALAVVAQGGQEMAAALPHHVKLRLLDASVLLGMPKIAASLSNAVGQPRCVRLLTFFDMALALCQPMILEAAVCAGADFSSLYRHIEVLGSGFWYYHLSLFDLAILGGHGDAANVLSRAKMHGFSLSRADLDWKDAWEYMVEDFGGWSYNKLQVAPAGQRWDAVSLVVKCAFRRIGAKFGPALLQLAGLECSAVSLNLILGFLVELPASLLDLAEAEGLRPDYSCRAGVCGSCETRVISGDVAYRDPPLAAIAEDSALICCAHPATIKGDLVLDL